MSNDQGHFRRAAAGQRVREIFERETQRLDRRHEDARQRDALAQGRALKQAALVRRDLEEAMDQALEEHDRLWKEESRKFSPGAQPGLAPGGPLRRRNPKGYAALEERFAQGREEIARPYEERLEVLDAQSERLREEFARASGARERQQTHERERMFREQAESFERRVESELAKDEARSQESTLRREFGERARDTGPDIAD